MEDDICAFHDIFHQEGIPDISQDNVNCVLSIPWELVEPTPCPERVVIRKRFDLVTALNERFAQVGTDETVCAGYEKLLLRTQIGNPFVRGPSIRLAPKQSRAHTFDTLCSVSLWHTPRSVPGLKAMGDSGGWNPCKSQCRCVELGEALQ
jgi:hypothetical protein